MKMAALGALATGITICIGVVIAIGPSLAHTFEHNAQPRIYVAGPVYCHLAFPYFVLGF